MDANKYAFNIPEDLIAQHPAERRDQSRLMRVDRATAKISHHRFSDILDLIPPRSLLVFNNARVRKARLFGRLERDGRTCEFLFLEKTGTMEWQTMPGP